MKGEHIKDRFLDYIYGELGESERRSMEDHLAHCDECSRFFREQEETLGMFRKLQDPSPPRHLNTRILAHAREARGKRSFLRFLIPVVSTLAVAVIAVSVFLVAGGKGEREGFSDLAMSMESVQPGSALLMAPSTDPLTGGGGKSLAESEEPAVVFSDTVHNVAGAAWPLESDTVLLPSCLSAGVFDSATALTQAGETCLMVFGRAGLLDSFTVMSLLAEAYIREGSTLADGATAGMLAGTTALFGSTAVASGPGDADSIEMAINRYRWEEESPAGATDKPALEGEAARGRSAERTGFGWIETEEPESAAGEEKAADMEADDRAAGETMALKGDALKKEAPAESPKASAPSERQKSAAPSPPPAPAPRVLDRDSAQSAERTLQRARLVEKTLGCKAAIPVYESALQKLGYPEAAVCSPLLSAAKDDAARCYLDQGNQDAADTLQKWHQSACPR